MTAVSVTVPAGRLAPGQRLDDRYTIVQLVGEGAVGEVYEAWDEVTAQPIALKTLHAEVASHPVTIERFRRELQLASMVPHRNVCRVFHLGRHSSRDGTEIVFLTMELLRGITLAQHRARRGRLTLREVMPLGLQMAAGLRAVHEAGIIYRDLKPGNLMLAQDPAAPPIGPPRVVITDFGLARRDGFSEEPLTSMGQALGTPLYMAPEQVTSGVEPVTFATDVYALGTVLYELVANRSPFEGTSSTVMKLKCWKERPPAPRRHVPDLDPRLDAVIMGCLERAPSRRFQTARDVEAALAECVAAPFSMRQGSL